MQERGTQHDSLHFRKFTVAAGFAAGVLFMVVGVLTRLEMFGDGSIFSYAVAAQDAWAFHWHNIPGRLFTYVCAYVVPQELVRLTGSARAGIAAYGALFFSAPLFGLLITFAADRSPSRTIFTYACISTAVLCPFVYGAPTEMWMAQALFWPALALCLFAPPGRQGAVAVFLVLLALVLTHEGAVVLELVIVFVVFLRGWREPHFMRAGLAFCAAVLIWATIKLTIRPDDYISAVLAAAAFKFIDIRNLAQPATLTLAAALAAYACSIAIFRALGSQRPHLLALAICVAALAVFWLRFDRWLLTGARYDLRTALLMGIPIFGMLAALQSMTPADWSRSPFPLAAAYLKTATSIASRPALSGALALVLLVHAVETGKFVYAWTQYKAAIRTLATGTASDPQLGSPLFVSSERIRPDLNRLDWNSTTPFLSVLVAPGLNPSRLVVDPSAGYFWLSCRTARESETTSTALPEQARRLIRLHACLHRPD
jgi:hypothetical protein